MSSLEMKHNSTDHIAMDIVRKSVMIVDDSAKLRTLISHSISDLFDVVEIENPLEAILVAESTRPDLILLDINMPHIDGYELLRRFTEHPLIVDIPTVCMSSDADLATKDRMQAAGAAGFLNKPFNYKNLGYDLICILEGLNQVIENSINDRSFHIYFNSRMKSVGIDSIVAQDYINGYKTILLSWNPAEKMLSKEQLELVKNNEIFFLQFKSSVISKFPYLEDLSGIVKEIQSFVSSDKGPFHLIFDEPRNLFNLYKSESSMAQAMALSNALYGEFEKVTFASTRLRDINYTANLQKLGRVLLGE